MNYIILIYGSGVIGKATGFGLERLGHDVIFYDIDQKQLDKLKEQGHKITSDPIEADIYFVCVPEIVIDEVIRKARTMTGICVIRSTVPVGTTSNYNKEFMGNPTIIHNPEFLREGVAEYEFMNPHVIVIGDDLGNKKITDSVLELYNTFNVPKLILRSIESEMLKLTMNAFLSCQISFWNEMHLICKDFGIDSTKLGHILKIDPRVPAYGSSMHGSAFGGKCLPKDLNQLLKIAKHNTPLLEAIKAVNDSMKK